MWTLIKYWLFFILIGCQSFDFNPEYRIPKELSPYVNSFFNEAAIRGIFIDKSNLVMTIQNDLYKNGEWGLSINNGGQRSILIDKDYFDFYFTQTNNPDGIESLIFHELGHSLLNRVHVKCESIMNPAFAVNNFYEGNAPLRKTFIDELFKPCNGNNP